MSAAPLVVWQLSDGRRGHERQVEGLLAALAERVTIAPHRVALHGGRATQFLHWLRGRSPERAALPAPRLVVGVGSRTEFALLAARRAHGGAPRCRAVYLMRPGLPLRCFDACIVPRHDGLAACANVIASEGTLSPMRPAVARDETLGVILLGGPSAHHAWDSAAVARQVERIVSAAPALRWQVSDSRRSPADLLPALRARLPADVVTLVPFATCAPTWLPATLAQAAVAWVSADSVAMLYEALSAGARLGVIDVPARRADRITTIAPALIARGWAAPVGAAAPAGVVLAEAARCADALLARWPDLRHGTTRA
ncbi:MAG: ELM1/GtrOC1 family putative glycosyltransferase [Gammaproteobacteria bacterium]